MNQTTAPAADSAALAASKYGQLVESKLRADEAIDGWFMGMYEPNGFLMIIPVVGTILEFKKRQFLVVLTNQRLIIIEFSKPFLVGKEKQTETFDRSRVVGVSTSKGPLTTTLRIRMSSGPELIFKNVSHERARDFASRAPGG